MRFSDFNIVKFIEVDSNFDSYVNNSDIFYNLDNKLSSESAFKSNLPTNYVAKFLNNYLFIQFQSDTLYIDGDITIKAYDCNNIEHSINAEIINITPSTWISGGAYLTYIYQVRVSIIDGYEDSINLRITDETIGDFLPEKYYVSEPLSFHESLKDHIKIKYGNSENDFGMIFYDDTGTEINEYYVYAFIQAKQKRNPSNTRSIFQSDRGNSITLRSTPTKGYKYSIPLVDDYMYERISFITACNDIYINGVSVSINEDGLEENQYDEYWDGIALSLSVTVKDWDYRTVISDRPIIAMLDEDDITITDEDEISITT